MKFIVTTALFLTAGVAGDPPKYPPNFSPPKHLPRPPSKYGPDPLKGSYTVCTPDTSGGMCELYLKDGTPTKARQYCDGPKPCLTDGNGCTMNYKNLGKAACSG
ncbi:hypothetical protein Vi05172_g8526 [Venturia inaequalis]|nr:hypothetical protein Vi05172_g8526 [Venturia inaequalis]